MPLSLPLQPGQSLGPFYLGMCLNDAVVVVHRHKDRFGCAEVQYGEPALFACDLLLRLPEAGCLLRFEPTRQLLGCVEVYDLTRLQVQYGAGVVGGMSQPATFQHLYRLLGPTYPGWYDESASQYMLQYPGLVACFPIPPAAASALAPLEGQLPERLADGTLLCAQQLLLHAGPPATLGALQHPAPPADAAASVHAVVGLGIMLQLAGGSSDGGGGGAAWHRVCFGDSPQDVVCELGPPKGTHVKSGTTSAICCQPGRRPPSPSARDYLYNYLSLGLDVLFDGRRHAVSKILLHTNAPCHADFGLYHPANFALHVPRGACRPTSPMPAGSSGDGAAASTPGRGTEAQQVEAAGGDGVTALPEGGAGAPLQLLAEGSAAAPPQLLTGVEGNARPPPAGVAEGGAGKDGMGVRLMPRASNEGVAGKSLQPFTSGEEVASAGTVRSAGGKNDASVSTRASVSNEGSDPGTEAKVNNVSASSGSGVRHHAEEPPANSAPGHPGSGPSDYQAAHQPAGMPDDAPDSGRLPHAVERSSTACVVIPAGTPLQPALGEADGLDKEKPEPEPMAGATTAAPPARPPGEVAPHPSSDKGDVAQPGAATRVAPHGDTMMDEGSAGSMRHGRQPWQTAAMPCDPSSSALAAALPVQAGPAAGHGDELRADAAQPLRKTTAKLAAAQRGRSSSKLGAARAAASTPNPIAAADGADTTALAPAAADTPPAMGHSAADRRSARRAGRLLSSSSARRGGGGRLVTRIAPSAEDALGPSSLRTGEMQASLAATARPPRATSASPRAAAAPMVLGSPGSLHRRAHPAPPEPHSPRDAAASPLSTPRSPHALPLRASSEPPTPRGSAPSVVSDANASVGDDPEAPGSTFQRDFEGLREGVAHVASFFTTLLIDMAPPGEAEGPQNRQDAAPGGDEVACSGKAAGGSAAGGPAAAQPPPSTDPAAGGAAGGKAAAQPSRHHSAPGGRSAAPPTRPNKQRREAAANATSLPSAPTSPSAMNTADPPPPSVQPAAAPAALPLTAYPPPPSPPPLATSPPQLPAACCPGGAAGGNNGSAMDTKGACINDDDFVCVGGGGRAWADPADLSAFNIDQLAAAVPHGGLAAAVRDEYVRGDAPPLTSHVLRAHHSGTGGNSNGGSGAEAVGVTARGEEPGGGGDGAGGRGAHTLEAAAGGNEAQLREWLQGHVQVATSASRWEAVRNVLGDPGRAAIRAGEPGAGAAFGPTRCYGYRGAVLEVMSNGHLASVTLFQL